MANFPTDTIIASQTFTTPTSAVIPIVASGINGIMTGAYLAISGTFGNDNVVVFSITNEDQSKTFWSTTINSGGISGQTAYPHEVLLSGPYTQSIPFSNGVAIVVNFTGSNNPNFILTANVAVDFTPEG